MRTSPSSSLGLPALTAWLATGFAALLPALPAQSPDGPGPRFDLRAAPIAAAPHEFGAAPTGLWAYGPDYKVSFHDGFAFYPFVGPKLPHQPFQWRTVSVRAGEHELLAADRGAVPRADGFWCSYDLGPVTERYEVRDEGVEQSFVVRERPPAGDLVVMGEVTTPLRLPATAANHGPLSLCLPDGTPVVGYGAAFAIDARGVKTPITTATEGNRIVLRVAAEVVAGATFPLVIDPLVGSTILGLGSGPVEDLDVLYEQQTPSASQAGTWYTWTIEVAAGDRDLRLWRTGDAFTGTIIAAHEAITLDDDRRGSIGLSVYTGRVVLAYQHFSVGVVANIIRVHAHDVTDLANTPWFQTIPVTLLGGFSVDDDTRPDVGGNLAGNDPYVMIVFQREAITPGNPGNTQDSRVYRQPYNTPFWGTPVAFAPAASQVVNTGNVDQERPTVNQTSVDGEWLVAYQEIDNATPNDDWDIEIVRVSSWFTGPTGLATVHATDITTHAIDPQIAGSRDRYVLTYTTRTFEQTNPKPTGSTGSAVHAQRIDWNAQTATGSLPHPVVDLATIVPNGLDNGGSAFDRISESHWCATVRSDAGDRFRIFKLGYTGNVVEEVQVQMAAGFVPDAITTTFDSRTRTFPVLYSEFDTGLGASVVRGTVLEYVAVPPPQTIGLACGSGVWAGVNALRNRQQVGSENASLRLTGAPENTVALLIASTVRIDADGALIGAPSCTIVPDLANGFLTMFVATIQNGDAEVRVDLPEAAGPGVFFLQWAYFATGANPLNMQFSEGLRLDVDR